MTNNHPYSSFFFLLFIYLFINCYYYVTIAPSSEHNLKQKKQTEQKLDILLSQLTAMFKLTKIIIDGLNLVSLFNGIPTFVRLFNAKAILLE